MIVELEVFNGPIELLLNLIEKERIDIYDIPINHITESYMESIEKMDKDSDDMIDFIVMASSLIEIKSKMMLPIDKEEEEDPREDLVKRLLEYKKAKKASLLLAECKNRADLNYSRYKKEIIIEDYTINLDEDVNILSDYFSKIIINTDEISFETEVIPYDNYKVDDYIKKLKDIITQKEEINLSKIIYKNMPKAELIVYFLSLLELVRSGFIRVKQKENDVKISLRNDIYER